MSYSYGTPWGAPAQIVVNPAATKQDHRALYAHGGGLRVMGNVDDGSGSWSYTDMAYTAAKTAAAAPLALVRGAQTAAGIPGQAAGAVYSAGYSAGTAVASTGAEAYSTAKELKANYDEVTTALPELHRSTIRWGRVLTGAAVGLVLLAGIGVIAKSGKLKRNASKKKKKGAAPWWAAVAVGTGLVLFPEPATTATGLAILALAFGYKVL